MDPLTTPEDATAVTGTAGITAAHVATATSVVEAATGAYIARPAAVTELPYFPRDLRLLTAAVQWQAAHLVTHPDALDNLRPGLASASTNGVSEAYEPGASSEVLAPLAARFAARLSWRRSGGLKLKRAPRRPVTRAHTLTLDPETGWEAL